MARIAKARPKFIWVHRKSYTGTRAKKSKLRISSSIEQDAKESSFLNPEKRDLDSNPMSFSYPSSRSSGHTIRAGLLHDAGKALTAPLLNTNQATPTVEPSNEVHKDLLSDKDHERGTGQPGSESVLSALDTVGNTSLPYGKKPLPQPQSSFAGSSNMSALPVPGPLCRGNDGSPSASEVPRPAISMLRGGNSDPFKSTTLVITPELNRILVFMRDAVLPAIYSTDILRQWSSGATCPINLLTPPCIISFQAAYGDWQQQSAFLSDEGMALAGLSAWCHLLPSLSDPQRLMQTSPLDGSSMRARSCALLTKRLQSEQDLRTLTKDSVLHIFWLFRSEAISGNREAARIHGDRLRVIVKHAFTNGNLWIQSLIQFLFVDIDLATACMEKTIFDIGWFAEVLQPLWLKGKSILPPIDPQVYLGVSDTVEIQNLVSASPLLVILHIYNVQAQLTFRL